MCVAVSADAPVAEIVMDVTVCVCVVVVVGTATFVHVGFHGET